MRLGQTFAWDLDLLASADPGWNGDSKETAQATDVFGTAFGSPICADPQVASEVGSSHFEPGIWEGFDPDRHHASAEIAFTGQAKTGTGCGLGRNFQGVSLSPIRIGGILHSNIQSGAAEKVVEPKVDVLGEVLLDSGRPYRACRTLRRGRFPIVGGASLGIAEGFVSGVECLGVRQ